MGKAVSPPPELTVPDTAKEPEKSVVPDAAQVPANTPVVPPVQSEVRVPPIGVTLLRIGRLIEVVPVTVTVWV